MAATQAPEPVASPPASFTDLGAIIVDLQEMTFLTDVDGIPWHLIDHRKKTPRDYLYEKLAELITDESVLMPCIMAHELINGAHILTDECQDVLQPQHALPVEANPLQ